MTTEKDPLLDLEEQEFYDMVYTMSRCLHAMLYIQDRYVSRYRRYRCEVYRCWRFLCISRWSAVLTRDGCDGHAICAGGFSCHAALKKLNRSVQDAELAYRARASEET